MPADRLGNRLRAARNLGSLAAPVSLRDALDRQDRNDVARLRLSSRSTLTLQVSGIQRKSAIGVDVFIPKSTAGKPWKRLRQTNLGQLKPKDLRRQFTFLSRSKATSGSSNTVNLTLDAGEYYLRLYFRKNSTAYRLVASATPLPLPTDSPSPSASPSPPPPASPSPPPPSPPSPPTNPPASQSFTRNWVRQFGSSANDYAYGIAVNGGTLFVAGSTNGNLGGANAGDRDSYVAQLSTEGSAPILRQFGRSGTDVAADIVADSAGNYYVSGIDVITETIPFLGPVPNPNGYAVKYGSNGTPLWSATIATTTDIPVAPGAAIPAADAASRIAIDAQGNVYVTGFLRGLPPVAGFGQPSRAFIAKYNSSGNQQWVVELNELSGSSSGTDITLDAQGNIYLSGITNATLTPNVTDPLTGGDAFVAKLNGNGARLWHQTIEAPGTNLAGGVVVDSGGNVYITGDTIGALPGQTSAGGSDAFLAKYDSNGTRQWIKQFGTAQLDESQAIAIDDRDRIYLAGETTGSLFGNAPLGLSDGWLATFDSAGTLLGSTLVGTPQDDDVYSLIVVNPAPNAALNSPYTVYLAGQTQGTFLNGGINNQGSFDAWAAQYSFSPV
ncbi:SBBP repeat-containing protein [Leptolyngbya sp. FACHB-711]|uniref:SBBP repeat-containing protein n=1 Tax=unclassified Leptolyngbya TaxID=2650499 RepID=UPI001683255C|nr:SBBP repeat-containing protein [Leptolyngbya sp. FACHB-711]MBD1850720.1 SBBP repeat-containing protein [Cyanobacteria bacterium FACHB-502]MBD2026803.1 SBBP repeat-containing protein [Leptolyngbya sp. FACHB-711]